MLSHKCSVYISPQLVMFNNVYYVRVYIIYIIYICVCRDGVGTAVSIKVDQEKLLNIYEFLSFVRWWMTTRVYICDIILTPREILLLYATITYGKTAKVAVGERCGVVLIDIRLQLDSEFDFAVSWTWTKRRQLATPCSVFNSS